jgi:hypothetical protein
MQTGRLLHLEKPHGRLPGRNREEEPAMNGV